MIANGSEIQQVGSACLHVVNCSQLIHHSNLNISLLGFASNFVAVTALSSIDKHTHQTVILCLFRIMHVCTDTFNICL